MAAEKDRFPAAGQGEDQVLHFSAPDGVETRVATRLARQVVLSRHRPPRCTFYIHESALHIPVGGSAIMSEQLHHLLRMSVRSYITLRVVPLSIGAHTAMAGAFKLMEFAEFRPVVYVESECSNLFLEKKIEIQAHRKILAALAATALSEEQSREVIRTLATELYGGLHDHEWAQPADLAQE